MSNQRAGAWALIASSAAFVLIMAVHPTHVGAPGALGVTLNGAVHAAALLMIPLWAYGGLALHDHAGRDRPLSTLALTFWLFAAGAILVAATISGFVTPRAIDFAQQSEAGAPALHLAVWLNRGFAQANAAMTALAILLWSIAWPGGRAALALRLWGGAVALGLLGWQASGTLALDVHQTLIVTIAIASWLVPAALTVLLHRED